MYTKLFVFVLQEGNQYVVFQCLLDYQVYQVRTTQEVFKCMLAAVCIRDKKRWNFFKLFYSFICSLIFFSLCMYDFFVAMTFCSFSNC